MGFFFDELQIFAALSKAKKKGMKNIKFGQTLRFLYVEESFYNFLKSKYWVSIKLRVLVRPPTSH